MQITVKKFELCGGDAKAEWPENFSINGQRVVQPAKFLRATAAKHFNRRNTVTTIAFTLTREHASYAAAVEFALEHEATIPDEGDVVINSGNAARTLSDCQLEVSTCDPIVGCTTVHHYRLIGGRFA